MSIFAVLNRHKPNFKFVLDDDMVQYLKGLGLAPTTRMGQRGRSSNPPTERRTGPVSPG